jgi:hypothetical protein
LMPILGPIPLFDRRPSLRPDLPSRLGARAQRLSRMAGTLSATRFLGFQATP